MALINCKECGKQISNTAKNCPYCGFRIKKSGCLKFVLYAFLGLIAISILVSVLDNDKSIKSSSNYSANLRSTLNYLNEIEEVAWVEIDDNDVYIGFNTIPLDLETICNAAAFHGNKAIDFGVHVWAIDARKYNKGWRPGDGTYWYEVTYRYGKKED